MLDILVKSYEQLTKDELYTILHIRSAIFVVEQNVVYQDLDNKDQKATHIIGYKHQEIVAYTRIFKPGDYFENASIGRVLVIKEYRKFNFGKLIMKASVKAIETYFNESKIQISAQQYLNKFYTDLGFVAYGEGYIEDDIPHVAMLKN